jgi:hypothetical protein
LTTLNDITFVEAARAMAESVILKAGKSNEDRLKTAFQIATARRPSANELKIIVKRYELLLTQFTVDNESATKLLAVGESKRDESLDPIEHAASTALCLLLLNLDETLTKE